MKNKMNKMTKILLGLLLTLSYGVVQAQGIKFETGDWDTIKSKAKAANKLIFVDAYTTWCGPCKLMDKYTFTDEKLADFHDTNFISYKIDAEKGDGPAFAKQYKITSYPNLLFIDGDGRLVIRKSGALDTDGMLELGNKALSTHKEAAMMVSKYNKGNRTPEFILKYLTFLKNREQPTEEIASWYFAMIEQAQWMSKENQELANQHIRNPYNPVFEYIFDTWLEKKEAGKLYVDVYVIYREYIRNGTANKTWNDEKAKQLLAHANKRLDPKTADYLNYIEKRFAARAKKDWENYIKHTIAFVNKHYPTNYVALNNYAWGFYTNEAITDKKALNEAIRWVNIPLEKDKKNPYYFYYLDTKAALLYKLGRKKEALKLTNETLNAAKKVGADPSETLKLIEKIKAR